MSKGFSPSPVDGIPTVLRAPGAQLDYQIDWSRRVDAAGVQQGWLNDGETISTCTWTVPAGLTTITTGKTASVVTIWLGGGTVGMDYFITATILTSQGRTDSRAFRLQCRVR